METIQNNFTNQKNNEQYIFFRNQQESQRFENFAKFNESKQQQYETKNTTTFQREFNECFPSQNQMIGKRVKPQNFGEVSETDICEENDDDGEGKKYFTKRARFNECDMNTTTFGFNAAAHNDTITQTAFEFKTFKDNNTTFINNCAADNKDINSFEGSAFTTQTNSPNLTYCTFNRQFQANTSNIAAEFGENNGFFPELKKRETKEAEKQQTTCIGCKLQFPKLKVNTFCHNCFKIFNEVAEFVDKKGGVFEFTDKKCVIKVTCHNQHIFTTDYKLKVVKKWCQACKNTVRDKRKDYYRQADNERQAEFERMQREMFERARTNSNSTNQDDIEDEYVNNFDEETKFEDSRQEEFKFTNAEESQRFFNYIVNDNVAENNGTQFSETFLREIVEYIIYEPDYRLIQMFKNIQKDKRMRAYRRLARNIHPDKNAHILAKDAFQKLLRLSSSLRSPSLHPIPHFQNTNATNTTTNNTTTTDDAFNYRQFDEKFFNDNDFEFTFDFDNINDEEDEDQDFEDYDQITCLEFERENFFEMINVFG
ncbi:UNKNOWN [Stylonychia lemnae]|uniref:J domain-containing protein n=1 Tax=Stylonychia lemnae TaxID=5949 RepID=A0A078A7Q4_STYLE|nr:UNKNOWN [Stylonychia lemnae]|eukprot:CDW78290.1 UNKNOWN [Stylonychia lemnae]